jgi:dipeptidyl aminopeptidase/acylaminoacyl peptidase
MFLPDGRRFLFFIRLKAGKESHQGWIASASLDGKKVKRIVAADGLVGVAQGYLLYTIAGAIYAQPFDVASLSLRGEPAAIPGRPYVDGSIVHSNVYVEGATLAFRSDPPKLRRLVFVDRGGREVSQVGPPQEYARRVSISPDGRRALVLRRNPERGDDDIWMLDLERGTAARSGSGVEEEGSPVWSPDGSRFVHGWDREGPYDLVIRTVDGSKPDEVVVRSPYDKENEDWSRDGRFILFQNHDPNNSGLDVLTVGSSAAPQHLRGSEHSREFALSPDGRWLLSTSAESGRREVYVQRFPEGSGRQQVSVNGGAAGRWNPNGKEIFFVSPEAKLMSVSFEASSGAPKLSIPSPLFSMSRVQLEESYPGSQTRDWDVMPDGKRFLLVLPVSETDRSSLTVVVNWTALLEHP